MHVLIQNFGFHRELVDNDSRYMFFKQNFGFHGELVDNDSHQLVGFTSNLQNIRSMYLLVRDAKLKSVLSAQAFSVLINDKLLSDLKIAFFMG